MGAYPSSDMIDAHLHVWGAELLEVSWLADERSRSLRRAHSLDDAVGMLRAEGISSAVAVVAEESEAGSALLLARCNGSSDICAVVGWSDLTAVDAGDRIDALLAGPGGAALRGVRHVAFSPASLDRTALSPGLLALADRSLVLEVLADEKGLLGVAALCAESPRLRVVVDHLGNPAEGGPAWREGITALAGRPQAHLKVSGAVVQSPRLPELLAFARDRFGAERLLAGTDWPIHTLTSGSNPWRALHDATRTWSADDRAALFGANAARVYGAGA